MTASVRLRIQIFTIYKPILDPTELQGSEHPSQQNRFGLDRPWPRRIQGEKPYIEQGNSINPSEARLKLSLPATRRSKTKSTRARLYPRSARRRPSTSRARGVGDGGERRRTLGRPDGALGFGGQRRPLGGGVRLNKRTGRRGRTRRPVISPPAPPRREKGSGLLGLEGRG